MTRSLKVIGASAVALAIVAVTLSAVGHTRESAATGSPKVATISPEDLTRVAAPMPVHDVDSYQ